MSVRHTRYGSDSVTRLPATVLASMPESSSDGYFEFETNDTGIFNIFITN